MSNKPIIPNGYKIDDKNIIKYRLTSKKHIELYLLENVKYLYLMINVDNIPESKIQKFDVKNLNIGNKEYKYFVSKHNYEESLKELYTELTTLTGFDAVAGMEDLKAQLIQDVIYPLTQKDKFEKFKLSIPNGILLYGPPGCGKTFIVRKLAEDEVIKEHKKQNKINNILLFGIGNFGNKVVAKMKNIPNVSKLCSDINKKWLEDSSSDNDKLLFLENYHFAEGIWDTNDYADIYKQMILNEDLIIDKIQGFDYIILCTNSDDKMNSCLSEAVADTCKKLNKRFMICHSRDNFLHAVANAEGLSKQRSIEFVEKMQRKKYILNEIPLINTNLAYIV